MIYTDGVHVISDVSLDELHSFMCGSLGFKRSWFQDGSIKPSLKYIPHYDLTTKRACARALKAGAVLIPGIELAKILRAAPYNQRD